MKYFIMLVFLGCGVVGFSQLGKNGKEIGVTDRDKQLSTTQFIDSLKETLVDASQDKLFDLEFGLFREYLSIDKDSSKLYLEKALDHALKSGDSIKIVIGYNGKATTLKSEGDLTEANKLYERALGIAKRNQFCTQIKILLNNLALSYTLGGAYEKALVYNFESLKIREADGQALEISIALNNLGYLYGELGDYANALIYYEKVYQIKVKNNIKHDFEITLLNIAGTLIELGQYKEAEEKAKKILEICEREVCGNEIFTAAFESMGIALFKQNKLNLSEKYLKKSLRIGLKYKMSQQGFVSININASSYYWLSFIRFNERRFLEAIQYLDSSQVLAGKAGLRLQLIKNYELYSRIYSTKNDYRKAFNFQILYHQLNSEILSDSIVRKISRINADHEARENLAKISSQAEILKLQRAAIEQHKSLNYLIGIVAFLTFGLAVIFYRMSRQKHEINKILDRRVMERTIELEENRDKLKRDHDQQSIVLRHVSSDLTASLASLRGLAFLAMRDLPQDLASHFKKTVITSERISDYVKHHMPRD